MIKKISQIIYKYIEEVINPLLPNGNVSSRSANFF